MFWLTEGAVVVFIRSFFSLVLPCLPLLFYFNVTPFLFLSDPGYFSFRRILISLSACSRPRLTHPSPSSQRPLRHPPSALYPARAINEIPPTEPTAKNLPAAHPSPLLRPHPTFFTFLSIQLFNYLLSLPSISSSGSGRYSSRNSTPRP